MSTHTDKPCSVYLCVLCLLVAMASAPIAMAEEPSASGGDTQGEDVKTPEGDKAAADSQQPAPPPPSKIEKLPVPQLVQQAKSGDLKAQFELGSRLNYGRSGMPKDVKEALRWLRRAAQGGQQDAQRLLAVKLYNGFEVPADHAEALRWTMQLAEAGDVAAQLSLANMYAAGDGTDRNLVRACMWYGIAAASAGKEDAPEGVEKAARSAAEQRDKVVGLLLPEQEVEAQRLSTAWWLKKQGVSLADEKSASSNAGKSSKSRR